MWSRKCDCPITSGITFKGMSHTKVFQCSKHGLICPFDSWQFKTPKELIEHLQNEDQDKAIFCEGRFRYGDFTLNEAIFELKMFDEYLNKDSPTLQESQKK